MGVAMTGVVIPSFVVAPLLVMIFAITLHWLPGGGWNGGALKFMILPMVALSWPISPVSPVSPAAR